MFVEKSCSMLTQESKIFIDCYTHKILRKINYTKKKLDPEHLFIIFQFLCMNKQHHRFVSFPKKKLGSEVKLN